MPLKPSPTYPAIEVVSHTPPSRLNEDAWLVMQSGPLGQRIVFAAIDGATTRLAPPRLQQYLDSLAEPLTPAAYSARMVRDSLARQISEGSTTDLRTWLLQANADLGRALIELFGSLSLQALAFPEEIMATLRHDPRLVRLGLPASVVTLADYDWERRELRWAHVGDTALLIAHRDGRVSVPTNPGASDFDGSLKRAAERQRLFRPDLSFRELAQRPEVRQQNLDSGLRHNYVDEHGLPQPNQGIGVIDGLPELRYFVQTGHTSLDDALFVCAMTDGLEWPASGREIFSENPAEVRELATERRMFMAEIIEERGLAGYLALLRKTEAGDPDHEAFPRLKTHDDATGVLLRLDATVPDALDDLDER